MVSIKTKGGLDPLTGQPKTAKYSENTGVQERVNARVEAQARAYGLPCQCECNCRVRHRFGEVCTLCRDGDHWSSLDEYLDKITRRGL